MRINMCIASCHLLLSLAMHILLMKKRLPKVLHGAWEKTLWYPCHLLPPGGR